MAILLRFSALSDLGRLRRNNQDSGYASARLLMVADGMGGGPAGDVASATAVGAVRRLDAPAPEDLLGALAGALQRANDKLAEIVEADRSVEGMATTLTAVLADGGTAGLAHVGDSRAYLLRDNELTQLTHDHTFVQTLVDEGRISSAEARVHPHRSLILQVLDGRHDIDPDLQLLTLSAGDRLLLCSDGLSGFVEDEAIARLLAAETVDAAALGLVEAALDAETSDNVTCVVAEAVEEEAPAANQPPMLVGAAAEQARPRDRNQDTSITPAVQLGAADAEADGPADPEELRYAPQPPSRFAWLRRLAAVAVVLAVLVTGGWLTYQWTQGQYYVGAADGKVAIYRGIDQHIPGIDLDSLYEQYDVAIDQLPAYQRGQVEAGITANSLAAARTTVAQLQVDARQCASGQGTAAGTGTGCPESTTRRTTNPPASPAPTASATAAPRRTHSPPRHRRHHQGRQR